MEPVFHEAQTYSEAQEWDILQHLQMTPDERRAVARELKRRAYGEDCPDVRDKRRS